MKKQEFMDLGLTDELATKCEEASQNELKSFVPYERFKEVNDEKNKLKEDVATRDKQLNDLKKSTGNMEDLKKQIEDLQKDNKAKEEVHQSEIKQLKIDHAVQAAILNAKGKNPKAIKALLDLEGAELLEDGTVKGLKDQLETIAKSDSYLFSTETTRTLKGAKVGESKDGTGEVTKEQFAAMGYKERLELFNSNQELYNTLASNV